MKINFELSTDGGAKYFAVGDSLLCAVSLEALRVGGEEAQRAWATLCAAGMLAVEMKEEESTDVESTGSQASST